MANKPFGTETVEISWAAALEKIDMLESTVSDLKEQIQGLEKEIDFHKDKGHLDLRLDIEDLKQSPNRSHAPEQHVKHIKALLLKAPHHRETAKTLASRLGLTKGRTWAIIRQMEKDRVVNIINDPHHGQRKIIELHQQIGRT